MKQLKRYHNMRNRKIVFNPHRAYLQKAVDEYLKNGGEISQIVLDKKSYTCFLEMNCLIADADEFLLGN